MAVQRNRLWSKLLWKSGGSHSIADALLGKSDNIDNIRQLHPWLIPFCQTLENWSLECWSFFCFVGRWRLCCGTLGHTRDIHHTQLDARSTLSQKKSQWSHEVRKFLPNTFRNTFSYIQLNAEKSCFVNFVIKCRTFQSDISETEEKTTFEGRKQCVACLRSCQRDSTPRVEICWNTIQIPVLQIFAVCIFWWKMLWSSLSARQDDWQGICKPLSCNAWRKAAAGGGSRCRRPKAPRQHIPWHIAWHMATQSDTDINWDHEIKTRSGWDQDEIRAKSSETNCWAQLAIAFHIIWNMCIYIYTYTVIQNHCTTLSCQTLRYP